MYARVHVNSAVVAGSYSLCCTVTVNDLVSLKDMGSKMYNLISTLLPCLSKQIRLQAA